MNEPGCGELFRRSLLALIVGAAAVVLCYYYVDRQVAFFVHNHGVNQHAIFRWLTYPPPWVQTFSPLVLTLIVVRLAFGPLPRCLFSLFVACVSLIVADEFRTSLGDLFGRYWPETWFNDNPSLIGNGTYGFHPFQHGDDTGSFPSGHAARIAGFTGVFWLAYRWSRALLVIVAVPMLASLVAMNYHFVGDVVAGVVVGGLVAAWSVHFAGLSPVASEPSPHDR